MGDAKCNDVAIPHPKRAPVRSFGVLEAADGGRGGSAAIDEPIETVDS